MDSSLLNRHAVPEELRDKPKRIPYIFNRKVGFSASPTTGRPQREVIRDYEVPPIEFRTGPNGVVYGAISTRRPKRASVPTEGSIGKSFEESTMPGTAWRRLDDTRADTAIPSVNMSVEVAPGGFAPGGITFSPSPVQIRQGNRF